MPPVELDVADSIAEGVFPFTEDETALSLNPAIFTKATPQHKIYRAVGRSQDVRETGTLEFDGIRHCWEVEVNVDRDHAEVIRAFIVAHRGAGTAFYWYDIFENGFVYDPDGIVTTGRYLVRFDQEDFTFTVSGGFRVAIPLRILEIV